MLVRFNKRTIVGGTTYAKDAEEDIANDLADQVVRAGNGEVVGLGALSDEVSWRRNASGAYVWLTPDGVIPFNLKKLTVELANINNVGAQPSGSDWLFSAAQDLDAFVAYLEFTPTIFFDPDDTGSLNYGTEEEPYNTVADVNRVMTGNRAGTVLGIKFGSHLYPAVGSSMTASLLNLTCYGSATNPVLVVPYGDRTKPMPIIDGGYVTGTGTAYEWTLHSGSIWKITIAADTDVFENEVRCLKKNATPAAAGECQYTGGVLYYWPRETANPNDGTLLVNFAQFAVDVTHPDVAAQVGNIKFIGIDIRHARGNNVRSAPPAAVANITGIGSVDVLFCRVKDNGFDSSTFSGFSGSTSAIIRYGVHATLRQGSAETISSRTIGCDISGCTHHHVEFGQHDNSLTEYNYIHDSWGAPIEYYVDCSGNTFRNNKCENFSSVGRLYGTQGSFALLYNYTKATQGAALAFDDTHALNANNKVWNNWFKDCSQSLFECYGGTGHAIYNNTCDIDHDAVYPAGGNANKPSGLTTKRSSSPAPTGTTSAANGFLTFSNNLIYYRYSAICKASPGYLNPSFLTCETPGAGAAIPVGDKNCYVCQTGTGAANWNYTSSSQTNFGTYKTAMASYSFDQNSICSYGTAHPIAGGTYGMPSATAGDKKTLEQLLYTESTGRPATGSPLIQGGSNVNANRLTDYIGQTVLAVATPAIGCYER